MRKILIAFNGTEFCEGAFEFARKLNEQQPILLTGVFIPQASYANLWNYSHALTGSMFATMFEKDDSHMLELNINKFESLCIRNNIAHRIHKDYYDFAIPELQIETRFADLLIMGSDSYFENIVAGEQAEFMKEAILEAECAVLVVPDSFSFPTHNVIAYDGSASSVFSMKQFTYLFPTLAENETILVYSKEEKGFKMPYEDYVAELANQSYSNLALLKLQLNPRKYFATWLMEADNPILICGSFGRPYLSQLFKRSFLEHIIARLKLPVFIAHS